MVYEIEIAQKFPEGIALWVCPMCNDFWTPTLPLVCECPKLYGIMPELLMQTKIGRA